MTQSEVDREVSRATGESVSTIRKMGFGLLEPNTPEPRTIDWDELQAVELPRRFHSPRRMAMAA